MVIEILDNVKRGEFHLACYLYRFKILCTAIANFSSSVNELSSGSPSRIRIVLLISFGITTLPRSSILLTIPVAFMLLFHAFSVRSFAESCFLKTSLPEPNARTHNDSKFAKYLHCYCLHLANFYAHCRVFFLFSAYWAHCFAILLTIHRYIFCFFQLMLVLYDI